MNKGRPLTEVYPEVAATWHPERNGKLTPDQMPSKTAREVWWKCPAGHEWQERIATRTTLPKWKRGDVAACRHCSGAELVLTEYTYPECGHTRRLTKANRDKKPARCWDCIVRWRETIGKAELSKASKASASRAADLIAAIPVQEGTPEPLVREWRWWAAYHLQGAFGREAVGMDGAAVDEVLAMVTGQATHLLPAKADAGRAAAETGVLKLLDQAHWANGWLHHLTGRRPRPVGDDELAAVARLFADWFGELGELHDRQGKSRTVEHGGADEGNYWSGRGAGTCAHLPGSIAFPRLQRGQAAGHPARRGEVRATRHAHLGSAAAG